jgi:Ca2+-binding RTX toxin-like protein
MKTAKKGILATDMIDTDMADLLATDTMILGTTAAQTIGTAQFGFPLPNSAVRDTVFNSGGIVGLAQEGTSGNDTIYGTERADALWGFAGNDVLHGGAGDDELYGGADNDGLYGGEGADLLNGGAGMDTANYSNGMHGVRVDLAAGQGFGESAEGDILISIENVIGTSGGDDIIGNAADNILNGLGGNDQIRGGAGRDTIIGGGGYDMLTGDDTGFMAADTFVFAPHDGGAYITDFQRGLDKIDITAFGPGALGADGQLAWGDGDSHRSLGEGDRLYFDTRTNKLYVIDPFVGEDSVRLNIVEEVCTIGADLYRLQTNDLIFV